MYKGFLFKSRTYDWAMFLAVFGVVQQSMPMMQEQLGGYYGFLFMTVGAVVAVLRAKTKGPVGEK